MIWGIIFLSFGVCCFYCHLLFVFGGSNTRAWRHQLGVVLGWEGGASMRVKSQLPSLGLEHIWGTTYVPSSMWKQTVASFSMTYMKSDPDWFHPLSCPASPETTLVSLGEFLFFFFCCTRSVAQDSSICSKQGLLCNLSTLFFNSVLLLSRSQAPRNSGWVVLALQLTCPGAFAIFHNHISNTYLKHWIKRENTLERIWNASLLHENWIMAYLWVESPASTNLLRPGLV